MFGGTASPGKQLEFVTSPAISCFQFEADRRAFIITINSFGTELTKDDRVKLYPRCGKLFPDGLAALGRADDYEQVKAVAEYYSVSSVQQLIAFHAFCSLITNTENCSHTSLVVFFFQEYKTLFEGAGNNPGEKTLEDKFFEYEVCVILQQAVVEIRFLCKFFPPPPHKRPSDH